MPGLESSGHDAGVTCEGTDSRWKQRADTRPVSTKLTDYWRALGSHTRAGRWHAGGTPQGGAAGTRGQATAHAESGGRETPAASAQARRRAGTLCVQPAADTCSAHCEQPPHAAKAGKLQHTHKCVWASLRGPAASARTAGNLFLRPTQPGNPRSKGRKTRRTWRAPASSKDHPGAHSTQGKASNGKAGGIEHPRALSGRRQWRAAACRAPRQAGHLLGASQPIAIARQDHRTPQDHRFAEHARQPEAGGCPFRGLTPAGNDRGMTMHRFWPPG